MAQTFEHIYCLTRPGSEPLLKQEVSEFHPKWKFAFSRPGLVTFKSPGPLSPGAAIPKLRFARRRGVSMGRGSFEEVKAQIREAWPSLKSAAGPAIQVYGRVIPAHREDPASEFNEATDREAESLRSKLMADLGSSMGTPAAAMSTESGSGILDVVQVDLGKFFWGISRPERPEFLGLGGESGLSLPEHAASRAYLKLAEALEAYGVKVEPEDVAVDFGCAPGGMSQCWLNGGARVTGVDRGEVAPALKSNPRFRWIESSAGSVGLNQVPARIDWVSIDIHSEPFIALRESFPLFEQQGLLGFFMNMKMNQAKRVKELPLIESELVRRLKLKTWFCKQLPSNRDEVAFFGLTAAGLARVAK